MPNDLSPYTLCTNSGAILSFILISHSSREWNDWFLLHNFNSITLVLKSVNSSQLGLLSQPTSLLQHPHFCSQSNLFFCLLLLISTCLPMHFESNSRKAEKRYAYLWHFWNPLFRSRLQSRTLLYTSTHFVMWFAHSLHTPLPSSLGDVRFCFLHICFIPRLILFARLAWV